MQLRLRRTRHRHSTGRGEPLTVLVSSASHKPETVGPPLPRPLRAIPRPEHTHHRHLWSPEADESICDPSSHHGRAAVIVPQRAVRVHAWDLPHRCASTTTVMHTVRHARIRWNSTPAAISTCRHPHWSSKPICTNNQDSVSPSPSQIANRAEHVIYLTTYMFLGP